MTLRRFSWRAPLPWPLSVPGPWRRREHQFGTQATDIEADHMEVVDAEKKAIFKGNVNAKRGK